MSRDWQPGDRIAERYEVQRVLGRGGMGVVLAAKALHLGQSVALKMLLRQTEADIVRRFEREAQIIAKLRGEHVCRVLDSGFTADGTRFMAMELLEGSDLGAIVRQRGALPVEEAVGYMVQACEGVAEAHLAGVVHRDLKPSNLFVTARVDGSPLVKVLDFGIAKISTTTSHDLTGSGAVLGSPQYMAPEQLADSKDIDFRADIWALGVTLFELLTGKLPFAASSTGELYASILRDEPMFPSRFRPDLPRELEEAVMRCLEKDPLRRFEHVADLTSAIAPFAPVGVSPERERITRMYQHLSEPPKPLHFSQAPGAVSNDHALATTAHAGGLVTSPATTSSVQRTLAWGVAFAFVAALGVSAGAYFFSTSDSEPASRDDDRPKRKKKKRKKKAPCQFALCEPELALAWDAPRDPVTRLSRAKKVAKRLEPAAELILISVNGLSTGDGKPEFPRSESFMFRYPRDGGFGGLIVSFTPMQAIAVRAETAGQPPIDKPKCPFDRVLASLPDNGIPQPSTLAMMYQSHHDGQRKWMVTLVGGGKVAVWVDDACNASNSY